MNQTTRREFLKDAALAGAAVSTSAPEQPLGAAVPAHGRVCHAQPRQRSLSLLNGQPSPMATGISWGVPWPQGAVRPNTAFSLSAAGSSPAAAELAAGLLAGRLAQVERLCHGRSRRTRRPAHACTRRARRPLRLTREVTNDGNSVVVDTGAMQVLHPAHRRQPHRIDDASAARFAGAGQLVCILQSGPANNPEDSPARERFLAT